MSTTDKLHGFVTSFDGADGLGLILLDDGRTVRFGISACRKFAPIPGRRVRVDQLSGNHGALRAGSVRSPSGPLAKARALLSSRAKAAHAYVLDRFDQTAPAGDRGAPAGFLLGWMIHKSLVSETLERTHAEAIAKVRAGTLTGRAFITEICDEKPRGSDLSDEGLQFWVFYYGRPRFLTLFKSRYQRDLVRLGTDASVQDAVLERIEVAFEAWRARRAP